MAILSVRFFRQLHGRATVQSKLHDLAIESLSKSRMTRLETIRGLQNEEKSLMHRDGADRQGLKRRIRHQLRGLYKIQLNSGDNECSTNTSFYIPPLSSMKKDTWIESSGPFHLRWLAKSYGLLGPILPYEAEAMMHIELSFGENSQTIAKRGGFIIPSQALWDPKVLINDGLDVKDKLYSILMIDADYPVGLEKRRHQLCLWARPNVKPDNKWLKVMPSKQDELSSLPPIPARGSDTHRILLVVLEHEQKIGLDEIILNTEGNKGVEPYQDRLVDVRNLLAKDGIRLFGYQFYRTCWTKTVSEFYQKLGVHEPIYGQVL